jgi:hypothetical protein
MESEEGFHSCMPSACLRRAKDAKQYNPCAQYSDHWNAPMNSFVPHKD